MLCARGQTMFGTTKIRSTVLFERRFWAYIVDREGLMFDARFVPGVEWRATNAIVYVLLRGAFEVIEPVAARFAAPAAFLLDEEHFEGAGGRRSLLFRAVGSPYTALDLRLRSSDLSQHPSNVPVPIELDARTWEAAYRMGALHEAAPGGEASATIDFLEGLARSGVLRSDLASSVSSGDDRFVRLWSALTPMVGRFYGLPTLQEVARDSRLSLRQTARLMTEFFRAFPFIGTGWREATRSWRLKLAVLGLSARDATVGEVARVAGYGSSEAMARAFRDAGMPSPLAVQAALREG